MMFVVTLEHRGSGGSLAKVCSMVAGDVNRIDAECDLARRDHMVALGWVQMSLQRNSGVCIRANVQCFHAREFVLLTHVVLMAFDVFPDERKWKTPSDFDDFVHCVACGSQASTGKDRGRSESSAVMRCVRPWLSVAMRIQGSEEEQ